MKAIICKKVCKFAFTCMALIIFVSASVWEGAAAVGGDFPETGLFIATNSFPPNTLVHVTNLENGKDVQVIVSSRLENSALLAIFSNDAADAIGLQRQSISRIRMNQSEERAAISRFAGFVGSDRIEAGELIVDMPELVSAPPPPFDSDYDLSLVPAESRPPEDAGPSPDSTQFIASLDSKPPDSASDYIDPSLIIPPIGFSAQAPGEIPSEVPSELPKDAPMVDPIAAPIAAPIAPPIAAPSASPASGFSAPMISALEKGRFYVQIGAYSKPETVEHEISKIDSDLPLAIMNAGSEASPIYRLLVGPVNLGESAALLHRLKATYNDAFVRQGI